MRFQLQIIIIVLLTSNSFGQLSNECFENAKYYRHQDQKEGHIVIVGDTATNITISIDKAMENVISCRFPYSPFKTVENKELVFDKIEADILLINLITYSATIALIK